MPIYKLKERNSDGLYKYRIRVNYTDSYGKPRQKTATCWGRTEAKDIEKKILSQINNKSFEKQLSVNKLHEEYCTNLQHDIRQSSLERKRTIFRNHISPFAGERSISKLDVKYLTAWKNYMNEKPIRLQTKKNAYTEFKAMMNYAVRMEYLSVNPLSKINNFRDAYEEEETIDFYTPEEFQLYKTAALSEAVRTDFYDYFVFFCIAYYTGARKGEIHALRWNCITDDYISIKKSISQKIKGGDVETPPKNKSSIRTIQIPSPLAKVLSEHKERQQKIINGTGQKWSEDHFICGYYKPLRDTAIDNENRKYAELANIKRIRIHDFRHSHASLLINNGINALEVARRLGHSDTEQTLKTYSHLFPKESERALNVLNNIL